MPNTKQKPEQDDLNPAKNVGDKKWSDKIEKSYGGSKSPSKSILENPTYTNDEPSDKSLEDYENDAAENDTEDLDTSRDGIESKEAAGAGWVTDVSKSKNEESKIGFNLQFTKKKGVIGGLVGLIIVVIGLAVVLGPTTALIHLKEVLLDKFDRRPNALMDRRNGRIMVKKMTSDPTSCKIKVKCRFKGMSQKEIDKFERRNPGSKIETEVCKSFVGTTKCKVKSITYIDETGKSKKIAAKDFKKAFRESPNLRKNVRSFNKSRVAHWTDTFARKMLTKLKVYIGKTKGVDSDKIIDDPAERKKEVNNRITTSVSGEGFDINVRPDRNNDSTENAVSKQLGEDMAEALAEEAEEAKKDKEAGKVRVPKLNNIYTAALQGVCMVRSLVSYAATAVKLKNSAVLIRYAAIFFRIADQTKAGDSKNTSATRAMALLAGILQKPNPNNDNKTAFDSAGYQYAAYGYLPKDNSEYGKYILGGGSAGTAGAIAKNKFAAGGCRVINFVGDLVLSIPIVGDAIGAAGSVAAKPFIPLIRLAATGLIAALSNTLITGNEYGDEAGNAIVGGVGGLSSMNNRYHGFFPLSAAKAVAYDNDARKIEGKIAADSGLGYQLDISNTDSFAGRFATAISPTVTGVNFGNILPKLTSFATTAASSVSVSTYAKSSDYIEGEYEQCPDDDYESLDVAADIYCNPQYGLDPNKVGDAGSSSSDTYDPDNVTSYMCGQDVDNDVPCYRYVDEDGESVPDTEYDKWIKKCVETDEPISSDTEGWPEGLDKKACLDPDETDDPLKYHMFHMNYFDEGFDDQHNDKADKSAATDSSDDSGGNGAFSGTAQEAAKEILSSGKVTLSDDRDLVVKMSKGKDTPLNEALIKVLASLSQNHTFTVSSLYRGPCSGSNHCEGKAADIGVIDGVTLSYNGHNDKVQKFIDDAANLLGSNCENGVPNQDYVNKTKDNGSKCEVFIDIGTGPHVHIAKE